MTLVKPTLTSPSTISPSNYNADWNPTLNAGQDYILSFAQKFTGQLKIQGGRHLHIIGAHLTQGLSANDGKPTVDLAGGDDDRIVWMEGVLIDGSGGMESDGLQTSRTPQTASTTILKMKNCRVENIRGQSDAGTNDLGAVSEGTHADVIQLPGGIQELWMEDCTTSSRYANLQLQRETTSNGPTLTVTVATRSGTTGTVTTSTAHSLAVGDFVEFLGITPSTWNGAFRVTAVNSTTQFAVFLGDNTPGSLTGQGTANKQLFNYDVGDIHLTRVNCYALINPQQYITDSPGETLNFTRFGAREWTNAHVDTTPFPVEAWDGSMAFEDVWFQTLNTSLANMIRPPAVASTYSLARATISGSAPNRVITWPSWPAVTGQVNEGTPPGGDFCPRWRVGVRYPKVRI